MSFSRENHASDSFHMRVQGRVRVNMYIGGIICQPPTPQGLCMDNDGTGPTSEKE